MPTYYLTVYGTDFVSITDDAGHSNTRIDDTFALPVPNVTYDLLSDRAVLLSMPTEKTYTVTFRTGLYPIAVEMLKGIDNITPTQMIRYVDLSLPANVTAMLRITPQGVEDLRYDKDGDGVFETIITPTVSVTGTAAQDLKPPTVAFSEKLQGATRLLTITATDSASGVKAVRYSLDGRQFQLYTSPISIDPEKTPAVYAFADDAVANRSSFVKYKPLTPTITLSRDSSTNEIIATLTIINSSTASVTANISINSAKLGSKVTTTILPVTIGTLAQGESVTRSWRFPTA